MTAAARIGLLGGTLDPIHVGHLQTALAAQRALALDYVYVLPSHVPPHRPQQPHASGLDGLSASDIELCAPGPSYTADTLARFQERSGVPGSQIFFITGADAFAEIETWYRYPEVLDLAHFAVVSRPNFPVERLRASLSSLADRMTSVGANREARTVDRGFRGIFLIDSPTPDISSTEIRRRLLAGETVTGMVPDAVERHIRQHRLYSSSAEFSTADHLHGQNN